MNKLVYLIDEEKGSNLFLYFTPCSKREQVGKYLPFGLFHSTLIPVCSIDDQVGGHTCLLMFFSVCSVDEDLTISLTHFTIGR